MVESNHRTGRPNKTPENRRSGTCHSEHRKRPAMVGRVMQKTSVSTKDSLHREAVQPRGDRPGWDSNPRIPDLQSGPLVHLGTRPGIPDIITASNRNQVRRWSGRLVSGASFRFTFGDAVGSRSDVKLRHCINPYTAFMRRRRWVGGGWFVGSIFGSSSSALPTRCSCGVSGRFRTTRRPLCTGRATD